MKKKRKVFAYITHQGKLLVFRQPACPEVGVQVPAGTVEEDEVIEQALLREIEEETTLVDFRQIVKLGVSQFDAREIGKNEIHERHFFHMIIKPPARKTWTNYETYGGESEPILFDFFWVPLTKAQKMLVAKHDEFLSKLKGLA